MNAKIIKQVLLVLLLCSFIDLAYAGQKSSLYIFGDSLSDVGNVRLLTSSSPVPVPPSPRYFEGRFSNRSNFVDIVWQNLGNGTPVKPILSIVGDIKRINMKEVQAINFAFGGSETGLYNSVLGQFHVPGLLGQVGMFSALKADNKVSAGVAIVWSGGNDYLNQFFNGREASPDQIVGNISGAIKVLYLTGMRSFIVPNLPDVSQIPIAYIMANIYQNPNIPEILHQQTIDHNAKLSSAIDQLRKLPGIKVRKVDIYSAVQDVIASNPDLIMPGPASGCLYNQPAPTPEVCGEVTGVMYDADSDPVDPANRKLLFWDEIHPTTYVHEAFAGAVWGAMQ